MAAIGEELVARGHAVTLSSTEREGSELHRKLAGDYGMSFVSAGPDDLNSETFIKVSKITARQISFWECADICSSYLPRLG